jgi:peptidyl-prolyl cis-trans isomerase B (cyclophilin B)
MNLLSKISLCALMAIGICITGFSQKDSRAGAPIKRNGVIGGKQSPSRKEVAPICPVKIKIITDSGSIIIQLSDSTPLHRDNFVKLVKQGFYDSLLFHRVIPQFMIQGGDPSSKYAVQGSMLGNGGSDMARIPAEFHPSLFHKKGVLAAARDGNPEKASSACQFYLVEGKVQTDDELNFFEQRNGIKYTPEQRAAYTTIGGTPQLDMAYTVFGEVISGMEVVQKIINAARDAKNRPIDNVRMRMEILTCGEHKHKK